MPGEVLPLYEPSGTQLHVDPQGHAGLRTVGERPTHSASASLSGATPRYGVHPADRAGMSGTAPSHKQSQAKQRKPTPEELNALADQMMAQMKAQHAAQMAMGPAVKPVDQGVPPWLQDYMAAQPQTNPYAPIPPPIQMTPEQRQAYGAERPAWLRPQGQ